MTPKRPVRKAVLPVAGLGTRFLPATKAQPKEMLPVVDKPLIQYAVEEAVASGIEKIILVSGPGKQALEEHFRHDEALLKTLESRGKKKEAELVRSLGKLAEVKSVEQNEPLGLGHAVGCAREPVGDEPFVVILPDDLIDHTVPATRQLVEAYEATGGSVLATEKVEGPEIESYGVMKVEPVDGKHWQDRLVRVTDLVEKPKAAEAPSPYVVVGRYLLEPEVFTYLAETPRGRGGEIQLTDALRRAARERTVHALLYEGAHYDAGSKLGFLQANIHYGLKHPELGPALRKYLKTLKA